MSKRNGSKGLYKRVLALKDNGSEPDPEVPELTHEARMTTTGIRHYGQLRYRHPVTGKWTTKGKLGRVPTPFELEALKQAHLDAFLLEGQGGTLIIRDDQIAFEDIRANARTAIATLRSDVDPKSAMGPQGLTVEQAIEEHIAEPREEPLSPATVEQYRRFVSVYLKPVANVPLRRLDSAALMKLKAHLHEAGPSLPCQVLRVLKAAWTTARFHDPKLGEFPPLPRGTIKPSRRKKGAIKKVDLPQWFAQVEKVGGQRRDVWLLGVMTGLRRNDLVSIRREDVDLGKGVLWVPKPKGGERRAFELPLSKEAITLVRRVLRSHNSEWLWPSSKRSSSGHIEHPEPRPSDGFSVKWTMHDLRKVHSSAGAAALVPELHLKMLMNHALPSGDVTGGYITLEAEDLRPDQQAITDWLKQHGLPL
jgi:integrase